MITMTSPRIVLVAWLVADIVVCIQFSQVHSKYPTHSQDQQSATAEGTAARIDSSFTPHLIDIYEPLQQFRQTSRASDDVMNTSQLSRLRAAVSAIKRNAGIMDIVLGMPDLMSAGRRRRK